MSTGMYGVVRDALSWVAVAGVMALVILNFDQVRAFNRQLLGLEHSERQTPTTALARADEDNTSSTAICLVFRNHSSSVHSDTSSIPIQLAY